MSIFESGYYYGIGGAFTDYSDLKLAPCEYIENVRARYGEICHKITFVTSIGREVSFGGDGGGEEPPMKSMGKIIAFAGTEGGILKRLGYYIESCNWQLLKPYVLCSALVSEGRANDKETSSTAHSIYCKICCDGS